MALLVALLAPISAHAFTVAAPELLPVVGRPIHKLLDKVAFDPFTASSGHEEITRQALVKVANALIQNGIDPLKGNEKFLGEMNQRVILSMSGALTSNRIVNGNYCTDMPKHQSAKLDLIAFWGLSPGVDWHNDKDTQTLHFLRGEKAVGALMSAKEACQDAQQKILKIALKAAAEWLAGNKEESSFLVGHATHVIQDSFSPAHARRGDVRSNFALQDVCYYGKKRQRALRAQGLADSICYHNTVDILGDGIWNNSAAEAELARQNWPEEGSAIADAEQGPDSESRELALKHEARLAREATARFLYVLATAVAAEKENDSGFGSAAAERLTQRLSKEFFNGSTQIPGLRNVFPQGAINCGQLR